jgi:hypothetical protein
LSLCEEALGAVQTRLASVEVRVRPDDDELEDPSDDDWATATRAVTDVDRQVAALRARTDAPPRAPRASWACCGLFGRRAPAALLPRPASLDFVTPFSERQAPTPAAGSRALDPFSESAPAAPLVSPAAAPGGRRGSGRSEGPRTLSQQLAELSPRTAARALAEAPRAPSPTGSLFSSKLPPTTSADEPPLTSPLTPPLTPPLSAVSTRSQNAKPEKVDFRWMPSPPYGQEAPL